MALFLPLAWGSLFLASSAVKCLSNPCRVLLRKTSSLNATPVKKYALLYFFTARQGFEPRFSPPKGGVLPLDDPAMFYNFQLFSRPFVAL